MEFCPFDVQGRKFLVRNSQPSRVRSLIQFCAYLQARRRRGISDQLDYDFVADKGPPSPILGNVTEHPMFDLVPLAGPGREMAYVNRHFELIGELLECHLPKSAPAAVATTAIGRDEQSLGITVALGAHFLPPPPDGLAGKVSGVT